MKIATKHKIVVEKYPVLDKRQSYIFCGTHSFTEDIISALATFDRSVYAEHDKIPYSPTTLKKDKNRLAKQREGYFRIKNNKKIEVSF